jgi:hypothetical protein
LSEICESIYQQHLDLVRYRLSSLINPHEFYFKLVQTLSGP